MALAGSLTEVLRISPIGFTFNESGADVDFRVESDGNANMLFVDGGNDRVGIGTSAPASLLHLDQGSGGEGLRFERDSYDTWDIELSESGFRIRNETDSRTDILIDGSGNTTFSGAIKFSGANPGILGSDTDGRLGLHSDGAASAGSEILLYGSAHSSVPHTIRFRNNNSDSVTIDSSRRVGFGTTTPGSYESGAWDFVVGSGTASHGMTIRSNAANWGNIYFADGTTGTEKYRGLIQYNHGDDSLRLGTAGAGGKVILSSGGDATFAGSVDVAGAAGYIQFSSGDNSYIGSGQALLNSGSDNDLAIRVDTGDSLIVAEDSSNIIASFDADGLKFNADTAAANALDDYEEGTWTPQLQIGGSTTGITYNGVEGIYTKVGRLVTTHCIVRLTSKGSETGAVNIHGLPFVVGSLIGSTSYEASGTVGVFQNGSVSNAVQALAVNGGDHFNLIDGQAATVTLDNTDLTDTTDMRITLTYFA